MQAEYPFLFPILHSPSMTGVLRLSFTMLYAPAMVIAPPIKVGSKPKEEKKTANSFHGQVFVSSSLSRVRSFCYVDLELKYLGFLSLLGLSCLLLSYHTWRNNSFLSMGIGAVVCIAKRVGLKQSG